MILVVTKTFLVSWVDDRGEEHGYTDGYEMAWIRFNTLNDLDKRVQVTNLTMRRLDDSK